MSILATYARPLSIPASSIPAGYVEVPCSQCGSILNVPAHRSREVQVCLTCERGEAERSALDCRATLRHLIHGTGTFSCLSRAERQEQLDGFGLGSRHTPRALPGADRAVVVRDVPLYTWDGESPDEATRDEIESRIELEFDADFGA